MFAQDPAGIRRNVFFMCEAIRIFPLIQRRVLADVLVRDCGIFLKFTA